jgi:hypothetical protein
VYELALGDVYIALIGALGGREMDREEGSIDHCLIAGFYAAPGAENDMTAGHILGVEPEV